MNERVQQLELWMQARESEHFEFKEAKQRYDFEELVDYCVALANEGGGKMVLGVTDKVPRSVVGTKSFDIPEAQRCLMYVSNQRMSNQSLRERFGLPESKVATASLVISAAKDAG